MPTMFRSALLLTFTSLFIGCGGPAPAPENTHGKWEALQTLQLDTLMVIGPDASMGNWKAVKRGASTPEFASGVDAFESAQLPDGMSEHADAKEKAVKSLRDLIAAAKSGGNAGEMEAAWNGSQDALKELNNASTEN